MCAHRTQRVRTAWLGFLEHPGHTHKLHKDDGPKRDFGERSEKRGEGGFFGHREGAKTFSGQESGGWGTLEICG